MLIHVDTKQLYIVLIIYRGEKFIKGIFPAGTDSRYLREVRNFMLQVVRCDMLCVRT